MSNLKINILENLNLLVTIILIILLTLKSETRFIVAILYIIIISSFNIIQIILTKEKEFNDYMENLYLELEKGEKNE